MYGLVVAGAYLADLSVGMTDDRAHRLLLLRMVDDFATKDGLFTHARISDYLKKYDWKLPEQIHPPRCSSFHREYGKTIVKRM